MRLNTLVTGGARSGKSSFAQELALKSPQPVLFVATAFPGDDEMRQRIEKHRQDRPPGWRTLEATHRIGEQVAQSRANEPTVVIDCITLLVSNVLLACPPGTGDAAMEAGVMAEVAGITDCMKQTAAGFIIVTNEVGLGLVPADPVSRLYRDLLGKANQALCREADQVFFMVSGVPLKIKPR
ncbi:MAG: bifunctional adenosylcobinamide kinase/adenosylcobinamide-phosphate guanylyltransferase [Chloroflexi bacterium]|nr:bifunctional adenosylcobinamide kinase/adenosylcobinamide-phosphate guanylyltransferase [Chloroflexota bacterium]